MALKTKIIFYLLHVYFFSQEVESRKRGPYKVSQSAIFRLGKTSKPTRGNDRTCMKLKGHLPVHVHPGLSLSFESPVALICRLVK